MSGIEPTSGEAATFEELMGELEAITAKLAAGDLGIEAAADLYERAERLHAQATERLNQVRARVEGLAGGPGAAGAGGQGAAGAGGQGVAGVAGQGAAGAGGAGAERQ